jgi:hypothetical protein
LVQGTDGSFYGTTFEGVTTNVTIGPGVTLIGYGGVFRITVPLSNPADQIARIQPFTIFGGTDVAIQIPSVAGETYQLQYSESMQPANWINTGGSISSIGGPMTLFESLGILPPQRFYRVGITP